MSTLPSTYAQTYLSPYHELCGGFVTALSCNRVSTHMKFIVPCIKPILGSKPIHWLKDDKASDSSLKHALSSRSIKKPLQLSNSPEAQFTQVTQPFLHSTGLAIKSHHPLHWVTRGRLQLLYLLHSPLLFPGSRKESPFPPGLIQALPHSSSRTEADTNIVLVVCQISVFYTTTSDLLQTFPHPWAYLIVTH